VRCAIAVELEVGGSARGETERLRCRQTERECLTSE